MTSNAYGLRLLRRPSVQLVVLALLAVLALAFRALQFAAWTGAEQWGYDFTWYWTAASNLLHGEPIYSAAQLAGPFAPQGQEGFLYPPPLAAAVIPLAVLFADPRAANWVWAAMGAAILAWSVLALHHSERLADRYPLLAGRGRWLLVAGAFAFPPVVGELVMGNVHMLLLGLLTAAWLGVRRDDPGQARSELAGVAVGIAAVIKLFPGLLLVWLGLTRRRRAAAGVLLGAAIFTLVTLPVTGLEPWTQYPTVLANLSAPSDTTDTLAPTVWLSGALGFPIARAVITVAGLALLAWSAARTPSPARSFAAAVAISVLIAPALYHHYLALLVLPLLLGLGAGVPLRYLGVAYFLMWGGDQPAFGDLAWVVNRALPTAGAMILLAALVVHRPEHPELAIDTARQRARA